MIIECNICQKPITYDELNATCPNDIIKQLPNWTQDDENKWLCPEHKLKSYNFIANAIIEANSEDLAKNNFANNSNDFAANAKCYLINDNEI